MFDVEPTQRKGWCIPCRISSYSILELKIVDASEVKSISALKE
jgi:hypothetical protein